MYSVEVQQQKLSLSQLLRMGMEVKPAVCTCLNVLKVTCNIIGGGIVEQLEEGWLQGPCQELLARSQEACFIIISTSTPTSDILALGHVTFQELLANMQHLAFCVLGENQGHHGRFFILIRHKHPNPDVEEYTAEHYMPCLPAEGCIRHTFDTPASAWGTYLRQLRSPCPSVDGDAADAADDSECESAEFFSAESGSSVSTENPTEEELAKPSLAHTWELIQDAYPEVQQQQQQQQQEQEQDQVSSESNSIVQVGTTPDLPPMPPVLAVSSRSASARSDAADQDHSQAADTCPHALTPAHITTAVQSPVLAAAQMEGSSRLDSSRLDSSPVSRKPAANGQGNGAPQKKAPVRPQPAATAQDEGAPRKKAGTSPSATSKESTAEQGAPK